MNESLYVYYEDMEVGTLLPDDKRRLSFTYSDSWLANTNHQFPVSKSMPLGPKIFTSVAHAYFSNLLPEGGLRDFVCGQLKISPENDYELLKRIGGDCAGALRILREEDDISLDDQRYEPLTDLSSAEHITSGILQKHPEIRLSLAGAQYKLPVYLEEGKLYLPCKHAPSSHILKFANRNYRRLPEVEFLVTRLAQAMDLDVIDLSLYTYGKQQVASLSQRYDRLRDNDQLRRLHQEDFCQVLGISAGMKYQNEGGPSLVDCIEIIRRYGDDVVADTLKLVKWMIFNVLVGNCDCHGKNLSFLYHNGQSRLSPCYDLVATINYKSVSTKMAMSIGGEEAIHNVNRTHWATQARTMGISPKMLLGSVAEMSEQIISEIESVFSDFDNINEGFHKRVSTLIKKQCRRIQQLLKA
jgi:serine/threonine-protein kinase HipA